MSTVWCLVKRGAAPYRVTFLVVYGDDSQMIPAYLKGGPGAGGARAQRQKSAGICIYDAVGLPIYRYVEVAVAVKPPFIAGGL